MLTALILFIAAHHLLAKGDRRQIDARRAEAMAAAKAAGLSPYLRNLQPSGAGWVFTVTTNDHGAFKAILDNQATMPHATARGTDTTATRPSSRPTAPGPFLSGGWHLLHLREANCTVAGQCRDYRSRNGAIGPGSLQVVYNRTTGQGYFDYDRWNPYESWRNLARHAEEI